MQQVLRQDPDNITALSNLTFVLADLQRMPELAKVVERLKQLRPYEPCHFFKIGKEAMRSRNYPLARDMFLREVGRQPNNHQFYFQLAMAYAMLGETRLATLNLSKALANSTTLEEQGLYAAKLAKIRAR